MFKFLYTLLFPFSMKQQKTPFMSYEDITDKLRQANLFNSDLVIKALNQSMITHTYQSRDDCKGCLEQHIYPVVSSVIDYYRQSSFDISPEAIAGAFLHDVLEDDKSMTDEKFIEKYGIDVYTIVKPITRGEYRSYPGETKYEKKLSMDKEYIPGLANHRIETLVIKAADRLNNVECVHKSSDEKKAFYIQETREFYLPLFESMGFLGYFTDKIKKRLDLLDETMENQ